jgi:hypothetical protein
MSGTCPRAERAIQYRRSAKSDGHQLPGAPREQRQIRSLRASEIARPTIGGAMSETRFSFREE